MSDIKKIDVVTAPTKKEGESKNKDDAKSSQGKKFNPMANPNPLEKESANDFDYDLEDKDLSVDIVMTKSDQELSYAYEDGGLKRIFIYGLKLGDTVKISIPSYPDVTLKAVNGNPFDPYTLREAK